jgi:hypothetical protein
MGTQLSLKNVGQIESADIEFGDLTVLVGPQATGKSILLQFLKLVIDARVVQDQLHTHGIEWAKNREQFLDIYFGEGMRSIWTSDSSSLEWNGDRVNLDRLVSHKPMRKNEELFFIPAQRVLTLGRGWPRPFTDYSPGDPFTARDFSEKLRLLMESGFGRSDAVFPQSRRLKEVFRGLLTRNVFGKFGLEVDRHGSQKRLVLRSEGASELLPFMVWSAGQREFVPLLLGLYWLLPPRKFTRRDHIEWVVIEEPEMGLHPRAISVVLLMILDLLSRGYRVCVSTHSPHVLDLVWALRVLREHRADPQKVLKLFDVDSSPQLKKLAQSAMEKKVKVFLFDRDNGRTLDISSLDPGSVEEAEAGWGGLTEFSGRAAEIVADVVSESDGGH